MVLDNSAFNTPQFTSCPNRLGVHMHSIEDQLNN